MHAYRTHTCGQLRLSDAGATVRLSGWVHRKRDHGQLLFVDLRDHYGVTQCVIDISSPLFPAAEALRLESVVTITGRITKRTEDTINPNLPTGEVELVIGAIEVQSVAEPLPFPVNTDAEYPEEMRLTYRFLDLRREDVHAKMMLRSAVIASIRRRITYRDALLKYGTDKPDLRNPLVIADVSEVFAGSKFRVFKSIVESGGGVRAIPAPGAASRPRSSFLDKMDEWARAEMGARGL